MRKKSHRPGATILKFPTTSSLRELVETLRRDPDEFFSACDTTQRKMLAEKLKGPKATEAAELILREGFREDGSPNLDILGRIEEL